MVTRKEGRKEGRWRWTESNRQSPEKKKQHERRHRSLKASQAIQASKRQPPRPARLSNGSGGVAASSVVHRMYAAQTAGAATAGIREYWRKQIERIANSRTPVARTSLSNISTRASSLHCERVPLTPRVGDKQRSLVQVGRVPRRGCMHSCTSVRLQCDPLIAGRALACELGCYPSTQRWAGTSSCCTLHLSRRCRRTVSPEQTNRISTPCPIYPPSAAATCS